MPLREGQSEIDVLSRILFEGFYFKEFMKDHSEGTDALPAYYYRYLRGKSDTSLVKSYPLRYVGIFPSDDKPVKGVVLYLQGTGCGIEYGVEAILKILESGFAVFTYDPMDVGLSAYWNPRSIHLGSYDLQIDHAAQFFDEVSKITSSDPRLQRKPKHLLAMSQGAMLALGALAKRKVPDEIQSIFFDNPYFDDSCRNDFLNEQVERIVRNPENAAQSFTSVNPSSDSFRDPRLSLARQEQMARYFNAGLGINSFPLYLELRKNTAKRVRAQLLQPEISKLLPPNIMCSLFDTDEKAYAPLGYAFLLALADKPRVVRVRHHLNITHNAAVLSKALRFFSNPDSSQQGVLRERQEIENALTRIIPASQVSASGDWKSYFRQAEAPDKY